MTEDEIRAHLHRMAEVVHRQHRVDRLADFFAEDLLDQRPPAPEVIGLDALQADQLRLIAGFPDYVMTPETIDVDGEWAAVIWNFSGVHSGTIGEFAPTGLRHEIRGLTVYRLFGGLLRERWQFAPLSDLRAAIRASLAGLDPPEAPSGATVIALDTARAGRS